MSSTSRTLLPRSSSKVDQSLVPHIVNAKAEDLFISAMDSSSSPPSWKLYGNPHFTSDSLPVAARVLHPSDDAVFPNSEADGLRSQLESERRRRREAESLASSLSLELATERRLRAEAEVEAERCRDAANLAFREAEEERRMLKFADSWREERVQMKLSEAAILLEEKIREVSEFGELESRSRQGRENMPVKKGVKGFVEFPRSASKAMSPGPGREKERAGGNLECQKSQLRILLRRRNTVGLRVVADAQSLVVR